MGKRLGAVAEADLATTLLLLGVSYLLGFAVADYLVRSRWGTRDWLWLSGLGEKFGFYTWPRPPRNVVRLITVDGRSLLFYNVPVKEQKSQVEIETPLGRLVAPEKASTPLPIMAIYLPGTPSPMSLAVYALGGLIAAWITFYYGYIFMGYQPGPVFMTLALMFMGYIYLWYQAASNSAMTEYHEYIATGIAPPYLHAIPSPNLVSPIRMAKYLNMPILIRVTDGAKRALEHMKRALGVESDSQVAELLASAEFSDIIMRKAVDLRVESERVAQAFRSFAVLSGLPRIRLGTGLLLVLFLLIGIGIGYLLGGHVVVGPPPHALYNASLAGGGVP